MKHDRKIKQVFPDYSGKYHEKLNDKISRKTAEKISKMQLQEKGLDREIVRI